MENDWMSELKKQSIKNSIKRQGNIWSLTCVLGQLCANVLLIFSAMIPAVGNIYTDDMFQLVLQAAFTVFVFSLPFIVAMKCDKLRLKDLISVKFVKLDLFLPLIFIAAGASVLCDMMASRVASLFNAFGLDPTVADFDVPDGILGVIGFIVTVAVLPAIFEEFAMRGIVMGSLRRYSSAFAIIVSSFLFGLGHGNFIQIPFAAAMGFVFAYIDIMSGSILPSVTAHFINNSGSAVQCIVYDLWGETAGAVTFYSLAAAELILGLVGFIWLCKKYPHPFAPIREKTDLSLSDSVKQFCASPGFIIACVTFGIYSVYVMAG